jgi:hypothetical protein
MAIFTRLYFARYRVYRDLDAAWVRTCRPASSPRASLHRRARGRGRPRQHPAVTADVTGPPWRFKRITCSVARDALVRVGRSLTADSVTTPPDQELGSRLAAARLAQYHARGPGRPVAI